MSGWSQPGGSLFPARLLQQPADQKDTAANKENRQHDALGDDVALNEVPHDTGRGDQQAEQLQKSPELEDHGTSSTIFSTAGSVSRGILKSRNACALSTRENAGLDSS